jgi:rSAM/selenodomain-associated transferase 2/rSAM/selenodomain-associated transferase 1
MPEAPLNHLLVLTRYPRPGGTKTRLIAALGEQGAADLQRQMTEHLMGEARKLLAIHPVSIRICFDGSDERQMRTWLGPEWGYAPQESGDLGRRMAGALASAFRGGAERAVLVGTDVPDLRAPILYRAFLELESRDLVLGPAKDGGYYLIGLQRSAFERASTRLFSGVSWGTGAVLDQTLAVTEKLNLSRSLTEPLADVDRPEDLGSWERHQRAETSTSERAWISVIVPALDEAASIGRTLASLPEQEDLEVIVVDGGSTDGTPELARDCGARVVSGLPPRSRQMNLGAADARGDIYLFLHADTLLPEGFADHVRRVIANPSVAAGAFTLKIDSKRAGIRAVERIANLRSRYLSLPYGDQALFVSAFRFWELRGFPLIPIMEDFALVRRLTRTGRIAIIEQPVVTSGRRWDRLGIVRTTLVNQGIVLAYHLGIAPEVLERWYRRTRYLGG